MSWDDAHMSEIRFEELVRILEEHREAGERKRVKFRAKLDFLKERQELLQQRRVDRLREEGIVIDIESVKRKARQSRFSVWRERKPDQEGTDIIEDTHGSGDEMDEYDSDLEFGRHSRGGSRALVHMDSTASLNRHSRLGRIEEEIEGGVGRRKAEAKTSIYPALQRAETKLSVVKSFQLPGRHDQLEDLPEEQQRKSNASRKFTTATNVVKAVGAFRSAGLSPRSWRGGGKQGYKHGTNMENSPNSDSASSPNSAAMSRESKAKHLFSYSGFNKK